MKLAQLLICGVSMMMLTNICMAQETKKEPAKRDVTRLSEDYFIPGRFKGKTIVITGGARGIGKSTAIRAVKEGANVIVMDWLDELGKQVTDSINNACGKIGNGKAIFISGNISKPEDCDRMIKTAVENFGKVDYAVLNAGVMDGVYSGTPFKFDKEQRMLMPAMITDATDEYWQNVFKTNAEGTFYSLRSTLTQMLEQGNGGAVVMVGSIAGMTGLAGNPAYVASKHAVNGLMRNAAVDYAPYGIRINSVNMAETQTPMVARAGEFVAAEIKEGMGFGMGRIKTMSLLKYTDSQHRGSFPWEQASNILYLISDEASALTGTVMATDGGWTAF
ncbi:SDR family oxidoreductase [Dysgonomonas sp. HDW5B]|uniref:SDR family NAD(P)-dependent oxidoreductase n=1 Tax=Dysgonomonas sp. HDW5B TaxID=2714927 RepID=UPI00140B84C9|nr:SDR family oxidoreductase [Dysgonomonas sp. HDW5B]QIK53441.1 SDR family oxidoreductase [Dysgonomonas sp. HDW5B]